MATSEECETALRRVAEALAGPRGATARSAVADRSVSCHLRDLHVTFTGSLSGGQLRDITRAADGSPRAQIRLAMTSDDLVALSEGSLNLLRAWASGRVTIEASVLDLVRLRKLL